MVRRVRIGRLPDSSFGLLISAAGLDVDAIDPLDGRQTTFNSNWIDMLQVHQIGKGQYKGDQAVVAFPELGFKPYMECRGYDPASVTGASGDKIYDDTFFPQQSGVAAKIGTNGFVPSWFGTIGVSYYFMYIIYKLPADYQG